jgi:DNA repair exonuclease SbcCD ATPase subunit
VILEQLELKNACQYKRFRKRFKTGVTGILGANGAGKSNLVKMMQATLTNDFAPLGTKKKCHRYGAEDEDSYIKATWNHNGVRFTVSRGISPANSRLKIETDENEITRSIAVREQLHRILSIDEYIIGRYLFVNQDELANFIGDSPTARKKGFAVLCGTDHAEDCWKELGDRLRDDSELLVDFIDNSDDLRAIVVKYKRELKKLKERKDKAEEDRLTKRSIQHQVEVIDGFDTGQNLSDQIGDEQESLNRSKRKLERLAPLDITDHSEWLDKHREKYRRARSALPSLDTQWVLLRVAKSARKSLSAQVKPKKPEMPNGDRKHIEAGIAENDHSVKHLEQILTAFEASVDAEVGVCPTCGADISTGGMDYEQVKEKVHELYKHGKALRRNRLKWAEYVDASSSYEADLREYKVDRNNFKLEVEAAEDIDVEQLTRELARCNKLTDEYEIKESQQSHNSSVIKRRLGIETNLEADVRAYASRVEKLTVKYGSHLWPTKEQHDEAQAKLDSSNAADSIVEEVANQIVFHKRELDRATRGLEDIKEKKEKTSSGRKWVEDLTRYRDFLHRDNFPRIITNQRMEQITELANVNLSTFEQPFTLEPKGDLDFDVYKPDGHVELASRLSKGEKTIAALSVRLAANQLFARDIGFMVLDEPTEGLNEQNLQYFAQVIENLSVSTKKDGQQIIIITHDTRLARVFDHLIEL